MENKKQSVEWKIALMHSLMSYVVAAILAFLIMFLASFALVIFGASTSAIYVSYIVAMLSIWLGVRTSGSYIARKYEINNQEKILMLATIYYVVVMIVWSLVNSGGVLMFSGYNSIIIQLILMIAGAFVFYLAGKRYIKNTIVAGQ